MLRAVVIDDSPTARQLIEQILHRDPELHVIGQASDGASGVEMVQRLKPDVVVMDIEMPRMNGFEATEEIMATTPTPIVIATASVHRQNVDHAMQALRAGALTLLARPRGPDAPEFEREARELIDTVKSMAHVKVVRRNRGHAFSQPPASVPVGKVDRQAEVVAIAASTGGPPALQRLLGSLPSDFPLPILIVQHISHGFTSAFSSWLDSMIGLHVKLATAGELLKPATVYIAPEDRHLGVSSRLSIELSAQPPIGGFRPSGTFLFESIAQTFGPATLAVILTGMGQDGDIGLHAVRGAGGMVIAQDEASCVIYGMPRAAVEAGLANLVLPLDAIAGELVARAKRAANSTPPRLR